MLASLTFQFAVIFSEIFRNRTVKLLDLEEDLVDLPPQSLEINFCSTYYEARGGSMCPRGVELNIILGAFLSGQRQLDKTRKKQFDSTCLKNEDLFVIPDYSIHFVYL